MATLEPSGDRGGVRTVTGRTNLCREGARRDRANHHQPVRLPAHRTPGRTSATGCSPRSVPSDLDALVRESLPPAIRMTEPLDLPPPLTETQTLARLRRLAERRTTR